MTLAAEQLARASGVLLAMAAGDALGAGYEFGPALPEHAEVTMRTGTLGFEPGEWTDDTSMAIVMAQALIEHGPGPDANTAMVAGWSTWALTARDVGLQTRQVLRGARLAAESDGRRPITADDALKASEETHSRAGRSGGNGSLMRTAPAALAFLDGDPGELFAYAGDVSRLTHWEVDAGEACGLWCLAIRQAVLTGELDVRQGLGHLPHHRRELWEERLGCAEQSLPRDFGNNGWVVEALQSAWAAIVSTRSANPATHVRAALEAVVRGGGDTDTVAAIAGSLLGAAYGPKAVSPEWVERLNGWPGMRSTDLVSLAVQVITRKTVPAAPATTRFHWRRFFGSS